MHWSLITSSNIQFLDKKEKKNPSFPMCRYSIIWVSFLEDLLNSSTGNISGALFYCLTFPGWVIDL